MHMLLLKQLFNISLGKLDLEREYTMQDQPSQQQQPQYLGEQWRTPPYNPQNQPHSSFPQPDSTPYPTGVPPYPTQSQSFQAPYSQPGFGQPPMQPYPVQPPPYSQPGFGQAPMQPYPYPGMQPQAMQAPMQPYPYPGMQPQAMQPYPGVQPASVMNTTVNVNVQQKGPGFLIRALYFLFIGWWLGYFWLSLGFGLCMMIITLPLGLAMLNRLPQVLTLRSAGTQTQTNVSVATMAAGMPGAMSMSQTVNVNINVSGIQQTNFLVRALYFLFIGWWAGWFWANVGYFLCVMIITLPIGLMMLNRLPMVLTLRKN